MAKKLIVMLTVLMILAAVFAVGVSAAEYYYENFEDVTPSGTNSKAHLYVAIPDLADGTPTAEYEVADGMLHFKKDSYAQSEQIAIGNKVPEVRMTVDSSLANADEVIIEFDFMFGDNATMTSGGEIISYVYVHDKRFLVNIGYQGIRNTGYTTAAFTPSKNVWYRGLMHIKMNEAIKNNKGEDVTGAVDVYMKERAASEYTYLQTIAMDARTSNNYYLQLYGDYRKDQDMYVDNVKVYDGIVLKEGFFKMNNEKIEGTGDVTSGTLAVNAEILNGAASKKAVYPVLTVFDASGRLLDCQIKTDFEFLPGTNEISIDYDTNGFYEDVQGGYIGFYFWKDLTSVRPIIEAVELK